MGACCAHLRHRPCQGLRCDVHIQVCDARCPTSDGRQANPWEYVGVISLRGNANKDDDVRMRDGRYVLQEWQQQRGNAKNRIVYRETRGTPLAHMPIVS